MIVVGIDVGAVSIKMAVLGERSDREHFRELDSQSKSFHLVEPIPSSPYLLALSEYRRIKGEPVQTTFEMLEELYSFIPTPDGVRVNGMGSKRIGQLLGAALENDFRAIARGVGTLHPDVKTIFEMGGVNSKFINLSITNGVVGIVDYEKNGDCAAGTGSFIDQQASRLQYAIEDVGDIVMQAGKAATVAGRCSVFAKSDMIHAQQKGHLPPAILKGLCEAVVRNFKGSICKGKQIVPKVAFIGGVAANKGAVQAMRNLFNLNEEQLIVPEHYAWMGAIGCALLELQSPEKHSPKPLAELYSHTMAMVGTFPRTEPLSMDKVVLLRNRTRPYNFEGRPLPVDAFLGIDIGSVSTNLVVLDSSGELIYEIYTRTKSRPIEVVNEGLQEIKQNIGDKIRILGVGATGSGRELIGKLVGADTINDEITAHKTGASYVGKKLLNRTPDTIFEIGGQDSKYIRIQDDIVVDFTMNEACAAGTGSFLEEQAERMDIQIKEEFSKLALSSDAPIRLGERCTVFMERDITPFLQQGAAKPDLTAGLAYSIAYNYLNRVVRGRSIGHTIYFQGGTAYNDSVAAAFATILNKEIIVPPHNGVIGAIGMALLAMEKMAATGACTTFRGYSLEEVDYSLKEFTCRACSNFCDIQEFTVEKDRTYWGDKCSDQFRRHAQKEREATIEDLIAFRENLLLEDYEPDSGTGPVIGYPRSMYFFEQFPFWRAFLQSLGFQVKLSPKTNKSIITGGVEAVLAEPCFPVKVAHGHVQYLLESGVDYLFIPNVINAATEFPQVHSHMCPWGQTLPFIINHSSLMEGHAGKLLKPTIHFREGRDFVKKELFPLAQQFGFNKRECDTAVEAGYQAQEKFTRGMAEAGARNLEVLKKTGALGIILVGRPYNVNDSGVNLDIARKLRDYYGVNVVPMDYLPLEGVDISDINDNMYWNYGKKILQAAKIVGQYPNLHIIYITNFKCGPDSYIKHYIQDAGKKPFLVLQFDGHSNDAGVITRCEAYLDSKGFLRWWKSSPPLPKQADAAHLATMVQV
jgi:predicted CoA-substrate-specific enzyme activase